MLHLLLGLIILVKGAMQKEDIEYIDDSNATIGMGMEYAITQTVQYSKPVS